MKLQNSQTKRGKFIFFLPPSLKIFVFLSHGWPDMVRSEVIKKIRVHDDAYFLRHACRIVTKTMLDMHDIVIIFLNLRKSPAKMARIEQKTHCSLIFETYLSLCQVITHISHMYSINHYVHYLCSWTLPLINRSTIYAHEQCHHFTLVKYVNSTRC